MTAVLVDLRGLVMFHDGGWLCLFVKLLGAMLVGSHDFPKELSMIALILGKK